MEHETYNIGLLALKETGRCLHVERRYPVGDAELGGINLKERERITSARGLLDLGIVEVGAALVGGVRRKGARRQRICSYKHEPRYQNGKRRTPPPQAQSADTTPHPPGGLEQACPTNNERKDVEEDGEHDVAGVYVED